VDHALAWAVVGLVLVIAELLTSTLYLLMLGVAAVGAAAARPSATSAASRRRI